MKISIKTGLIFPDRVVLVKGDLNQATCHYYCVCRLITGPPRQK